MRLIKLALVSGVFAAIWPLRKIVAARVKRPVAPDHSMFGSSDYDFTE